MNRMRVPRQHRRYSLPSISHSPLGVSRVVPEGSDTFQKALEELYSYEPNHVPPPKVTSETSLTGLSNIQEGDEEEYEEEDENDPIEEVRKLNRRHSSLSFYSNDTTDGFSSKTNEKSSDNKTNSKKYRNARKEYFIKHGHWPEDKTRQLISGKHLSLQPTRTQTSIAFGSSRSKPPKFTL